MGKTLPEIDELLREARTAIMAAEHGEKAKVKSRYADALGWSLGHFERVMSERFGRKRDLRKDYGVRKNADTDEQVRNVFAIKKKVSMTGSDARELPTDIAISLAEQQGLIPEGALKANTANRIAREIGVCGVKKSVRWEAKYANHAHLFDGSGSEHLFVDRELENGDALLGIRAKQARTPKNPRQDKDGNIIGAEPEGRRLVYYFGVLDAFSRVAFADVVLAAGENAMDSINALRAAWEEKSDNPLVGMPDVVYTDNGPLGNGELGQSLLWSLDIDLETHFPHNSRAKGKIERFWRTFWQRFETQYLLNWKRGTTLFELRQMLSNYMTAYNRKPCPHLNYTGQRKDVVYKTSLQERGVRLLPDESFESLASRSWSGVIDQTGNIRKDNIFYEVIDCPASLIGAKVVCRRNLEGAVSVRNPQTREWMETKPYEPVTFGEFRGRKHDINDTLEAQAEDMGPVEHLYMNAPDVEAGSNMVDLSHARRATARKETPANFESYSDAIIYVAKTIDVPLGKLREDTAGLIKQFVEAHWRDRGEIEEFAKGLLGALKEEKNQKAAV